MQKDTKNNFFELDSVFPESLINTEDLYMNAPCGYLSFRPDGIIVKINRTLCDWLQCDEFDVVNKKFFTDLLSKGGIIYYEMFYMPLLKMQGFVNEINFDIRRADATAFPALINSVVLKDEEGIVRAINVTVFDITDRKRYETELLYAKKEADAEKKRFELLADSTPDIIFTATPDGYIEYVNQRFYSYFNIQTPGFDQSIIFQRVHVSDKYFFLRSWLKAIANGHMFEAEVRIKNAFGKYIWHLVRAVPYADNNTSILKYFGSCTNIHEQKELLDRKDEFISVASHELKTPLASLKGYINILQKSKTDSFHTNILERCYRAINNMQGLVGSLLDVSQIHSGQLNLNLAPSNIFDTVMESIELTKANYASHQIILHYKAQKNLKVLIDSQRMLQVLVNLLTNAIKYSPDALEVLISVEEEIAERRLKISVKDFGIGIPKEKMNDIFEKYFRVTESANNNRVSGLGIGLYITKEIIRLHKSRIYVESEVHKGSVFYFYLPIL